MIQTSKKKLSAVPELLTDLWLQCWWWIILVVFIWSGAALGPLLAGLLSAGGWDQVFYMLMTADFLALLVSSFILLIEANN